MDIEVNVPLTHDDLWHAVESIGTEDGEADKIAPPVIAKLIELKFVELTATGLPQLTDKGERALVCSNPAMATCRNLTTIRRREREPCSPTIANL